MIGQNIIANRVALVVQFLAVQQVSRVECLAIQIGERLLNLVLLKRHKIQRNVAYCRWSVRNRLRVICDHRKAGAVSDF